MRQTKGYNKIDCLINERFQSTQGDVYCTWSVACENKDNKAHTTVKGDSLNSLVAFEVKGGSLNFFLTYLVLQSF